MTLADRPGWYGDSFVLPHMTIQPKGAQDAIMTDMTGRQHYIAQAGSRSEWLKLAEYCERNSRLAFGLSVALAAPLLSLLKLPGGGYHFFGPSSRNKTGLLVIAGSVYGGGGNDGFVRNWRMTDNGAEGVLADHNDLLLPLDELTMVDTELAAELYYMLGNGHGKARADKSGAAQATTQSRVLVLSSGENTAAHQIGAGKNKVRMTGGLAVRMLDIPIEVSPGESFEDLCGFSTAGVFAEEMTRIAKTHHGHAGPDFISSFIDRKAETIEFAERTIERFVAEYLEAGDDPQIRRAAIRFAIAASAGCLASKLGVLPWDENSAFRAAGT